jgi:hypothetical protein
VLSNRERNSYTIDISFFSRAYYRKNGLVHKEIGQETVENHHPAFFESKAQRTLSKLAVYDLEAAKQHSQSLCSHLDHFRKNGCSYKRIGPATAEIYPRKPLKNAIVIIATAQTKGTSAAIVSLSG